MEKRKLQETNTKSTQVAILRLVRQSLNSEHLETYKLWYVWFSACEIWKLVNCSLVSYELFWSIHEQLQTPEVIEGSSKNCRKGEEKFPGK